MSKVEIFTYPMDDYPINPHDIPLEKSFPHLKPEERGAMREFLDGYCEIAWQVWERLEDECAVGKEKETNFMKIRKVVDIIKKEHRENGA
jgi:hypothetical protein